MSYNISEILLLPVEEQKAIATAILEHLEVVETDDITTEEEALLDKRFADIESGNYRAFTLEEVKEKLYNKWQSK